MNNKTNTFLKFKEFDTNVNFNKQTFQIFNHPSGLKHIHIKTNSSEKTFCWGFKTPPSSDKGIPHILEHTTLCGSKNFPVKDPFFEMNKRSLSSFMNAMTYSNRTLYPFSTSNQKDFDNLMRVYTDSVFFPTLNYYDFLQEGWRFELKQDVKQENSDYLKFIPENFQISGVVFNEMKGVYDNPANSIYKDILQKALKSTPDSFDSGGDPLEIPKLSHKELIDFQNKYYNPSQATLVTYGDIDIESVHNYLENEVLANFKNNYDTKQDNKSNKRSILKDFKSSKTFKSTYFSQENKNNFYKIYRLGDSIDAQRIIDKFFFSLIFASNTSPFIKTLSENKLGFPGNLSSIFDSTENSLLVIGVDGIEDKGFDKKVSEVIEHILEEISDIGIPENLIKSKLLDFEFSILKDESSEPLGVKTITSNIMQKAMFSISDNEFEKIILNTFDKQNLIDFLRKNINQDSLKKWAKNILEKPSLDIKFFADKLWHDKRNVSETDFVKNTLSGFSQEELSAIVSENKKLEIHQNKSNSIDLLPFLNLSEVDKKIQKIDYPNKINENLYHSDVKNDLIGSLSLNFDVSKIDKIDFFWLSLWESIMPEIGFKDETYEQTLNSRSEQSRKFSVDYSFLEGNKVTLPLCIISATGLGIESKGCLKSITDFIDFSFAHEPDIINQKIKEILKNFKEDLQQRSAFSRESTLSYKGMFEDLTEGVSFWFELNKIIPLVDSKEGMTLILEKLNQIHQKICSQPYLISSYGSIEYMAAGETLNQKLQKSNNTNLLKINGLSDVKTPSFNKEAWLCSNQAGRIYQTFKIPNLQLNYKEYANLKIFSQILGSNYIHPLVREKGGAYGGNASVSDSSFVLSSFRDPRLSGTIVDFQKALNECLNFNVKNLENKDLFDNTKLGIIGQMDRPLSPLIKARSVFYSSIIGIDNKLTQNYRDEILNTSSEDMLAVARKYLSDKESSLFVLCNHNKLQEALDSGLDTEDLEFKNDPHQQKSFLYKKI